MLILAVVLPMHTLNLKDNGIRTTAQVQDIEGGGQDTEYDISFTIQDGETYETWTKDVRAGTQVDDEFQVAYLADDPSGVQDARDLGTWWVAPLIFVPVAGFAFRGAWTLWRVGRDTIQRDFEARYEE